MHDALKFAGRRSMTEGHTVLCSYVQDVCDGVRSSPNNHMHGFGPFLTSSYRNSAIMEEDLTQELNFFAY